MHCGSRSNQLTKRIHILTYVVTSELVFAKTSVGLSRPLTSAFELLSSVEPPELHSTVPINTPLGHFINGALKYES